MQIQFYKCVFPIFLSVNCREYIPEKKFLVTRHTRTLFPHDPNEKKTWQKNKECARKINFSFAQKNEVHRAVK